MKTCSCGSCTAVSFGISGSVDAIELSNGGHLVSSLVLQPLVVIRFVVHNRYLAEVLRKRRRLDLPLKARSLPWIVARNRTILQRPGQVQNRQQISNSQHRSARRREHVHHLEL